MNDNKSVDLNYTQGFNQGYYLAKHAPEIAEKIVGIGSNTDRIQGMQHGIEQYELEQNKERLPDWLRKERLSSLGKSNAPKKEDKDKGDIERE